jgi:hypothetical protein
MNDIRNILVLCGLPTLCVQHVDICAPHIPESGQDAMNKAAVQLLINKAFEHISTRRVTNTTQISQGAHTVNAPNLLWGARRVHRDLVHGSACECNRQKLHGHAQITVACVLFRLKNLKPKTPHTCLYQLHGGYCLRNSPLTQWAA